jgi:DNA-binding transcriptional LysR family regulator
VVAEAARAVRAAREARAPAGRVVIGATPSLAAGIVPRALRQVNADRPDLAWSLITGSTRDLEERVAGGELDVAAVTDAPPGLSTDPRLSRQPIGRDEMWVIVPAGHPVATTEDRLDLGALAEDTWVEDNEGSAALLRAAAARRGFDPAITLAAADLLGKTAMVAAGHAVAMVPGALVAALRPDVVPLRIRDAPTRGLFAVLPRSVAPRPEAQELVIALGEAQHDLRPRSADRPD